MGMDVNQTRPTGVIARVPLSVAVGQGRCPAAPALSEGHLRSVLVWIGVLAFVLTACARIPTHQEANDAVLTLRAYESWAWAVGIALLWADLLLPVPQTAVIAALGVVYGTLVGGFL